MIDNIFTVGKISYYVIIVSRMVQVGCVIFFLFLPALTCEHLLKTFVAWAQALLLRSFYAKNLSEPFEFYNSKQKKMIYACMCSKTIMN